MILGGTGHRPHRIRMGEANAYDAAVLARLTDLCAVALDHLQPHAVAVGGALGFDEALLVAALQAGMLVTLYEPFPGYDARWPAATRARYDALRARVHAVVVVTPEDQLPCDPTTGRVALSHGDTARLLHTRNRALVDASTSLVALWDGVRTGGTWQAVDYATAQGKRVRNLWGSWQRYALRVG